MLDFLPYQVLSLLRSVLSVLLLLPALAHATQYVQAQAYWSDPAASASFEQARSASYTPFSGVLARGFGPGADWIKLRVGAAVEGEAAMLVLRIRPTFLDQVTVYDPLLLQQGQVPVTVGDWTPWRLNLFDSLNHTLLIPAAAEPRDIWLRLTTRSTHFIYAEVLSQDEMLRSEHNLWMFYALLLALILVFMLAVLVTWLRDKDPVTGWFVVRQLILFLHTASYLGYHRVLLAPWLAPLTLDGIYNWLVLLATSISIVFEYRLLADYQLARWAVPLQRALMLTSFVAMSLLLAGQDQAGLQINMALNVVALFSYLVIVLCIPQQPTVVSGDAGGEERYRLSRRVLASYHLAVVLMLVLVVFPGMGWLQGSMFAIYGILLYGVVSGMLMTGLLIVRSRRTANLRRSMAVRLFQSQQELASESRRRAAQAQLLDMLIHELKNPLAVIDLAVKAQGNDGRTQGYVGRAVDNMNAILERCVQTDRMVERPFELRPQNFDLAQQIPLWIDDCKHAQRPPRLALCASAALVTDLQCAHIITTNLIENAYKYGDPQQPVDITLCHQPGTDGRRGVLLSVCNSPGAAGWPDPARVFTRYYRSPAAQRASGTGLGLFLSHNLAQQLGGELCYRQMSQQICFSLWLPI